MAIQECLKKQGLRVERIASSYMNYMIPFIWK